MTARTHDAFALASIVTVAVYFPPKDINVMTLFAAVIASDIGALIPDMDQAGSRLWDLLPAGDTLGKIFRRIFYKHRTLSHSILGGFLIYKFLEWLLTSTLNPDFINPSIVLWSLMVGFSSHLLADSMTKEGLPLLFPIRVDFGIPPVKKLRIRTGKWLEKYIVFPGVWIYLALFIRYNQEALKALLGLVN